jgi:hypothetical protein
LLAALISSVPRKGWIYTSFEAFEELVTKLTPPE